MVLCLLFLVSIPAITPYLRGDGNGYYAWVRSAVIDGDLHFENEYRRADPAFRTEMFDEKGELRREKRTSTGHVDDHWGVGAAALWSPFFLVAHAVVTVARAAGIHWQADGFSLPYRWACAFGTALFGFLSLLIAYQLARRRLSDGAALVGVLVVWGASSLFVYQYLLPFWPFASAAFVGALLLLLWDRPGPIPPLRWLVMGVLAGLAFAIHPVAVAWAVLPLLAVVRLPGLRAKASALGLLALGAPLGAAPQLFGKAIVYGSPFTSGYDVKLREPQLFRILFGANHGLFSWTPIAFIALVGIVWPLWRRDRRLAQALITVFLAMLVVITFFQLHEQSSYGNRFFVAFTPGFVIGAASVYESLRGHWRRVAVAIGVLAVAWNVLFAFQWAWGMTRKQGPVHWSTVVSNQFTRAPRELVHAARLFVTDRGALIHHVQQVDLERRRAGVP